MSDTDPRAVVRRTDEVEAIAAAGVEHLFRLTGADTGGRFAFEEFTVPPGSSGARPHVHHGHDEYFYVLSGTLTLHTGDGEVELGAGELAAAPRGAPHGFRNAGAEPVRGICMFTPAGYENYFRDVHPAAADGAEITEALLTELRGRYLTEPYG